jgi:Aldehyde oxidase and xanthine dehydrogenase, a/b hammerhead domain
VTAVAEARLLGDPVDRVDGPLKVTGAAPYPSDVRLPGMAHAALVRSTIAAGRIRHIDTVAAEAAPGVLAVITHKNAPKLEPGTAQHPGRGPAGSSAGRPPAPLRPVRRGRGRRDAAGGGRGRTAGRARPRARRRTARPRRRPRCTADQSVGHRHAARGRRRRPLLRRDHLRGDLHDRGEHQQPARPVRHRRRLGRRHRHGVRHHPVDLQRPGGGGHGVPASRGLGLGSRAVCRRRVRGGPARLAARAPDRTRRTHGPTAGQTGPHPAADVHRHRPPTQHGADLQDRRHTRRPPARHRPPGDPRRGDGRREHRAGHAGQLQRLCLPEPLRPRPAAATEHPTSRTDARARRGAGELRRRVRHRRTVR